MAQGDGCALQRLDARSNRLATLQELAVLAGCPRLQDLLLSRCCGARVDHRNTGLHRMPTHFHKQSSAFKVLGTMLP